MAIALDGSVHGNVGSAASLSVNLTTAQTNDIIGLVITANVSSITSVTDTAGLTWTQRATANFSGSFVFLYYAVAASVLSGDTITVTPSSTTFITIDAFGISGADTSTKFDSNVSLPATSATNQVVISTNNANDFLICAATLGLSSTGGSTPTGFTTISDANFQYAGYKIVSATQSSLTETVGHGAATIGDAIIAGAGGGGGDTLMGAICL